MVREPFEVAAGEGNIHGGGRGFVPVAAGDGLEDAQVEIVDGCIRLENVTGNFQIPGFQEFGQLVRNQLVLFSEAFERFRELRGNHVRRETQPGQLGDVPRQVPHPLKRGTHPQRTHDHPKITGHRTLEGQDVDGALVEAVLQEVDPCIRGDDVLGQVHVRPFEGSGCLFNGLTDKL